MKEKKTVENLMKRGEFCQNGLLNLGNFGKIPQGKFPLKISPQSLRTADVLHHLVFVGPLVAIGFYLPIGPMANFCAFYITGLPGSLAYLSLVLKKFGLASSLVQKRFDFYQHVLFRGPGLVFCSVVTFQNSIQGACRAPSGVLIAGGVLIFVNAIYYTAESYRSLSKVQSLNAANETPKIERVANNFNSTSILRNGLPLLQLN